MSEANKKRCVHCCLELPATTEFFFVCKNSKSGLASYCKPCCKVIGASWRERNRARYLEIARNSHRRKKEREQAEALAYYEANKEAIDLQRARDAAIKRCYQCGIEFPRTADFFQRAVRNKDALKGRCKWCKRKYQQNWVANNRERVRKKALERHRAHPEWSRAAAKNKDAKRQGATGTVSAKEWMELLERYKHSCCACGSKESVVQSHVVPFSKGGSHTIDNLQPLCLPCLYGKGKEIKDFRINL